LSSLPSTQQVEAPRLNYLPPQPSNFRPKIGLIGAGGISEYHLRAYRAMGLEVVAICDTEIAKADARRSAFYPFARTYRDYRELLAQPEIDVVDLATHAEVRTTMIEAALDAGKHVLSQKPFVTDLVVGRRLVELADKRGLRLAVNQNGRWAPHFSYLRQAVSSGTLGAISSIDFTLQWDHTWTVPTAFNEMHHLILFDFGIHWFDMAVALIGPLPAECVYASVRRAGYQQAKPPFLTHVVIDFPTAQVRMCFNAHVVYGQEDRTVVSGELGTARAFGPSLNEQRVQLWTDAGHSEPQLVGNWFDNGFRGSMGELLCAIEQDREPANSARENLRSLQLCFAAIASADQGSPVCPGIIERLPESIQAK
jgi:predicted dehydrogenase